MKDEPIGPLRPDDELDEEIAQHMDLLTARFRAQGLGEAEARARASARFGDPAVVRDACLPLAERHRRRVRLTEYLSEFRHDVAYGLRTLRRAPLFTAVAVLTLGVAIGANTAMFSVVNAVLLKALPYRHADRVVVLNNSYPGSGLLQTAVSPPEFAEWQDELRSIDAMAGLRPQAIPVAGDCASGSCEPQRAAALLASPNIFAVLGVEPLLGRAFVPGDGAEGAPRVVILSHALWASRFGGDSSVIGRTIIAAGEPHEVVGVMPRSVRFPEIPVVYARERTDLWIPYSWERQRAGGRGNQFLIVLARLRPEATVPQLRAELDLSESRFKREFADRYVGPAGWRISDKSLRAEMTGDIRPTLVLLSGIVALVLLIACANVANLLIARSATRQTEIAVRAALGAGRGRLLRQLLAESVVLGALAGVLGVVLALVGVRLVQALAPANLPHLANVGADGRVLLFALGISFLTSVLCGLIPAVQQSRLDIQGPLRGGATAAGGARAGRALRRGLVVAEVSLTLVVLVCAGLLMRSFAEAQRVDTVFDPRGVLTFELSLPASSYADGAAVIAFQQAFQERLREVPGVSAASAVYPLPLSGDGWSGSYYDHAKPPPPTAEQPHGLYARAMPGYFSTMGVSLVAGREFTADDVRGRAEVVIVNEELARLHWPGEDPIGKRLNILDQPDSLYSTVIGVVPMIRIAGIEEAPKPQVYMPMLQRTQRTVSYMVRGAGDPLTLLPGVRAAVGDFNASLPVARVAPMQDLVERSFAARRFNAALLGVFAVVALLLASVGLYGVVSYLVAQRNRELGLRLALGSTPGALTRHVVVDGMRMALAGIVLGLAGAAMASRALQGLLFGVSGGDPWTYAAVALLLAIVAFIASWLPARRVTRISPVVAMRGD